MHWDDIEILNAQLAPLLTTLPKNTEVKWLFLLLSLVLLLFKTAEKV